MWGKCLNCPRLQPLAPPSPSSSSRRPESDCAPPPPCPMPRRALILGEAACPWPGPCPPVAPSRPCPHRPPWSHPVPGDRIPPTMSPSLAAPPSPTRREDRSPPESRCPCRRRRPWVSDRRGPRRAFPSSDVGRGEAEGERTTDAIQKSPTASTYACTAGSVGDGRGRACLGSGEPALGEALPAPGTTSARPRIRGSRPRAGGLQLRRLASAWPERLPPPPPHPNVHSIEPWQTDGGGR